MSYQALYRKYRPATFDDVCGQNVTVKILKNSIIKNKISHAYLFYGPRGTGKTSIAKIFARSVNCLNPKDGNQCCTCDNCLLSTSNECVDIIEIDAASNNGVDEIRELKSKITFVPSSLKYKVYIIDEVHMLSTGAFNALLKTLEEPPEYVIFILATTEFSKVPTTIVSRCQTLEFKKISDQDIVNRLDYISKQENISIDESSLFEIAKCSNGGLRDSIGLLEKVSSYSDNIDVDTIRLVTGNISIDERNEFIKYLDNNDVNSIINKINEYSNKGIDLSKFIKDLLEYYANQYKDNNNTNICLIIKKLDSIYSDMLKSENPKLILEVSILNIFSTNNGNIVPEVNNIKLVVENKTSLTNNKPVEENKTVSNNTNSNKTSSINLDFINRRVYNTISKADKALIKNIRNSWNNISDLAFDENYGNVSRLLVSDINAAVASDEYIVLVSKLEGLKEQLNNDLVSVEKILNLIFNNNYKAICITEKEWNNYIELYKKDNSLFVYEQETEVINNNTNKKNLKEKAKDLFED